MQNRKRLGDPRFQMSNSPPVPTPSPTDELVVFSEGTFVLELGIHLPKDVTIQASEPQPFFFPPPKASVGKRMCMWLDFYFVISSFLQLRNEIAAAL